MPTRSTNSRVYRDENDRLKQQLAEVRQSCLLLNHKIEGSETLLSKQKDVILGLKQQLQRQEVRHAKELRALNEAHSQVLKNFVKKHCIEVSGLEKKVRSVQKILHTSLLAGEEGGEKTDKGGHDGGDKVARRGVPLPQGRGGRRVPPPGRLDAANGCIAALTASSSWSCWTGLSVAVFISQIVDRLKIGKLVSPPASTMIAAMVLSSLGVLPGSAPEYAFVWKWVMPMAASLYLLGVDLRQLKEFPKTFLAFLLGSFGTVMGTVVAYSLMRGVVGKTAWKSASALCASCIGGSLNFAAVSQALRLPQVDQASALAADSFVMTVFLMILMAIPIGEKGGSDQGAEAEGAEVNLEGQTAVSPRSLSFSLVAASISCCVGDAVSIACGIPDWSLALIALTAPLVGALTVWVLNASTAETGKMTQGQVFSGAFQLGSSSMLYFFATIGAFANFGDMMQASYGVFSLLCLIIGIHLAVACLLGKAFSIPLRVILIASNANIGGPATAAAMAAARGWKDLLQPAMLVGSFGYAVGTTCGLALSHLLRLY